MQKSEWRTIARNPNYEVSAHGEVRNARTGLILKQSKRRYCTVCLGKKVAVLVHRLVAEAFIQQPMPGLHVNHKNGNRHDNSASNLEWVTQSENNIHARRNLGRCVGEKHGLSRLTWDKVIEIRIRADEGPKRLGREFGVSDVTIGSIVKGKTWRVHWAALGLNAA